jgi:hypothetical protein
MATKVTERSNFYDTNFKLNCRVAIGTPAQAGVHMRNAALG